MNQKFVIKLSLLYKLLNWKEIICVKSFFAFLLLYLSNVWEWFGSNVFDRFLIDQNPCFFFCTFIHYKAQIKTDEIYTTNTNCTTFFFRRELHPSLPFPSLIKSQKINWNCVYNNDVERLTIWIKDTVQTAEIKTRTHNKFGMRWLVVKQIG